MSNSLWDISTITEMRSSGQLYFSHGRREVDSSVIQFITCHPKKTLEYKWNFFVMKGKNEVIGYA